jgi:predicted Zn finger-like uncharacterized protein
MRIVCPNCSTSYEIDGSKLGAAGRTVRCSRCRETWLARGPVVVEEVEALSWESMPAAPKGADERTDALVADRPPPSEYAQEYAAPVPALVADAPPLAPADDMTPPDRVEAAGTDAPEPSEDIESVAARRMRAARDTRHRRRRLRSLPLVILVFSGILAALVVWRAEVVRIAPQTAQIFGAIGLPVNLRGLVFEDLRISEETQDDVPVMVVQGRVVNPTKRDAEVPRLRFAVRNHAGIEVYAWTALPDSPMLKPGESMPFRSRLASPPADAKDVMVRFFLRRDLVAGQ